MDLCIVSRCSRQIAIGNGGPTSALQSIGGKPLFGHRFAYFGPIYIYMFIENKKKLSLYM